MVSNSRILVLVIGVMSLCLTGLTRAVDHTTNTINGVTTNGGATFTFPSSGQSNLLFILNAGVLTNGTGILGSGVGDGYNQIIVSDSGSVWSNSSTLWAGLNGSFNHLIVTNLGTVYGADINIANSGQGNQLLVGSTGQVNATSMIVGRFFGYESVLVVTNGGVVNVGTSLFIGAENAAATNNLMIVTGPGSRVTAGTLRVGSTGSSNQMVISNGGVVIDANGSLGPNGAFNNTALVTGSGSVWSNTSSLIIGANNAFGNTLTVAASGTVYTASLEIASNLNSYNNRLIITNGGRVFNSGGLLLNNAVGTTASNNWIIVTGAGSILTNNGSLIMGRTSPDNRMEITDGGVVINSLGFIGANDNGASNNTVLVSGSGSVWSNTSSLTVGGLGARNTLLVSSSGTVYAASTTLGSSGNSHGNQFIVTNGGRYVSSGGLTLGAGSVPGSSNNLLQVTGTGSRVTSGGLVVGGGSVNNQMRVEDGGYVESAGISRIGLQAAASNSEVVVTGAGSVWSNTSSIVVGSAGSHNRLIVTNNGTVFAADVSAGESTGHSNSILVHGGTLTVNGGLTLAPNSTPGASNNLLSIKGASSVVTVNGLSIGAGAAGNQMIVEEGATLYSGGGVVRIGNQSVAHSNVVIVSGSGTVWSNGSSIVSGNLGSHNRLVVTDGASVIAPFFTAGEGSGTSNSILVSDRGLVDTTWLTASAGNSISNIGGIYQFTTPTPTITAGRVFITDGTVSFRNVTTAPVTPLANLTYSGDNTYQLNSATNTSVASYTFQTGTPTNYYRLVLRNGRFQSTTTTFGADGELIGNGTVASANVTNHGLIAPGLSAGEITFTSNLVLGATSMLEMEIGGTNPADYDRLIVNGSLTLTGSLSVAMINAFSPTLGNTFTLIDNTGNDPVAGFFTGLTNNAFIDASGNGIDAFFRIQYDGGTGNDVILIASIPEPSTLPFLAAAALLVWHIRRR